MYLLPSSFGHVAFSMVYSGLSYNTLSKGVFFLSFTPTVIVIPLNSLALQCANIPKALRFTYL